LPPDPPTDLAGNCSLEYAAKYCGICTRQLRRRCADGTGPDHIYACRRYRFPLIALREYYLKHIRTTAWGKKPK
jgi:hypothetical protein